MEDCSPAGRFWIHWRGWADSAAPKENAYCRAQASWPVRKRQRDHCMNCIQLALSNAPKAELLRSLLCRSTQLPVHCVEAPLIEEACVVVVDPSHLRMIPSPLAFPERALELRATTQRAAAGIDSNARLPIG